MAPRPSPPNPRGSDRARELATFHRVPPFIHTLYEFLRGLPGSLKLAIALGAPVIAVVCFDWLLRRTLRPRHTEDAREMAALQDWATHAHPRQ